jgi:TolB protein
VEPVCQPPHVRRTIAAAMLILALALAAGLATWALLRSEQVDVGTDQKTTGRLVFMGEGQSGHYSLFGIFTARSDGAELTQLTDWESDIGHPSWSADGRSILFSWLDPKAGAIYVMNLDGGNERPFGLRGFDDLSPDGNRIANSVAVAGTHQIVVKNVDRTDRRPVTTPKPNEHHRDPVWSPDGIRILFERHAKGDVDLFTVDPDGGTIRQLTNLPGREGEGDWSPDGSRIVFVWRTLAGTDLYIIRSNGTGLRRLTDLLGAVKAPSWSPDGTIIAFEGGNLLHGKGRHFGIYTIRIDGTGLAQVTPSGDTTFFEPAWQPVPNGT